MKITMQILIHPDQAISTGFFLFVFLGEGFCKRQTNLNLEFDHKKNLEKRKSLVWVIEHNADVDQIDKKSKMQFEKKRKNIEDFDGKTLSKGKLVKKFIFCFVLNFILKLAKKASFD